MHNEQLCLLLTRDCGDLWEGELEQDLLLVVHHIDPSPVHSNYHIVFGQVRTCSKVEIFLFSTQEIQLFCTTLQIDVSLNIESNNINKARNPC